MHILCEIAYHTFNLRRKRSSIRFVPEKQKQSHQRIQTYKFLFIYKLIIFSGIANELLGIISAIPISESVI